MVRAGRKMGSVFVGIAGGSGSGKTTIAQTIAKALPPGGASLLELDAYYRDRFDLELTERAQLNFDHPDALDLGLVAEHLSILRAGGSINVPIYDFKTHSRRAESRHIQSTCVVIVEGILVLVDPRIRDQLDMKIFVDTDPDIRAFRRIRRDMEHRGRTFDSVREQYYRTVRPMHLEFVEPSKRWADLIVPEGGHNRVAIDLIIAKLQSVLRPSP